MTKAEIVLEQQVSDVILGFYDSIDPSDTSTDVQSMCDATAATTIAKVKSSLNMPNYTAHDLSAFGERELIELILELQQKGA